MFNIRKLTHLFTLVSITVLSLYTFSLQSPKDSFADNRWYIKQVGSQAICQERIPILGDPYQSQQECEDEIKKRIDNNKLWYKKGTACVVDTSESNNKGKYNSKANCDTAEFANRKWRITRVVNLETCIDDVSGPYNTKDECENALHPGNYRLEVGPGWWTCIKDNAGTQTYSQCQAEAQEKKEAASPTPMGANPCSDPANPNAEITNCPTALGNIPTNPTAFVGKVLTIAIGLAGGIALIIMVWGSIKVLTSGGEPKKMGEGREMIVAAISGLLFLILSVLILRFIGSTFLPTTPF